MISGQQIIGIGLQNEAAGSDSLYLAFNKTKDNFATLFACASPYNTFTGSGVGITTTPSTGTIDITNTGVTSLVAGDDSITLTSSNGNVIITATSGGSGGGVTSVGLQPISTSRLTVGGDNPVISTGTIHIDLATSGVSQGTYTYPTVTVDTYGRVTNITSGASVGTVTSVSVTPGTGIQVTGTNPITTSGTLSIINTGVTRLSAGTGIALSGSNGNVTISSTVPATPGTVTSVGLTSTTLTVSPIPVTTSGSLSVDLGSNVPVTGILTLSGKEILVDGDPASLTVTTSIMYPVGNGETNTLAAGVEGQIKIFVMGSAIGNRTVMVTPSTGLPNGGFKLDSLGGSVILQFINGTWFCVGNTNATFFLF